MGRSGLGESFVSRLLRAAYSPRRPNHATMLYQTGYLTIAGYDRKKSQYMLHFPNEEVKYSFLNNLLPRYISDAVRSGNFYIGEFSDALEAGDVDSFLT
jgi:hypothetical protein